MLENEKLSYCGIDCGGCKNYKENYNCSGCRYEKEMVDDCPTRACCIEKELLHCGECNEFPCDVLKGFYNDGVRHHEIAYENMQRILEVGEDVWQKEQQEKHTCKCGSKIRWFATECENKKCNS